MSLVFVQPGHAMGVGNNMLALYAPLSSSTSSSGSGTSLTTLIQTVPGATGWWDASYPGGLLGPSSTPVTTWNAGGTALIDLSGNGQDLTPFYSPTSSTLPKGSAHLSGLL